MKPTCKSCGRPVQPSKGKVVEVVERPIVRIALDGTVSRSTDVQVVACWCSRCGEAALRERLD